MKLILTSNNIFSNGLDLKKIAQTIYRGDESKIGLEDFDPEYGTKVLGKQLGTSMGEGPGMYFTTSLKNAKNYGEFISEYIINPNVNIISTQHPKLNKSQIKNIINKIPNEIIEIASSNWDEDINVGKNILIETILNNNNIIEQLMNIWAEIFYQQKPKMFMDLMKEIGIDGIIIDRGEYNNYVIYNLSVVKKFT